MLVPWFRMALNMADLLYTNPEKIISTHVEIFRHGCCFALTMQLILFAFSTIICSVQLNVQGPGGSYEIPFHQRSLGEVGHLHPPHPDPLQRGAHPRHYHDRTHLGDTGGRRETGGREDQEREISENTVSKSFLDKENENI